MGREKTASELLKEAYMERDWGVVLEAIELLESFDSDLDESVFENWG